MKNKIKYSFTEVNRVNWLVAFVNWTNDVAWRIILFESKIIKFDVELIKYSRIVAWIFNCLVYSSRIDSFNEDDS